ncbi:hypothetical protein A7Q01_03360 [Eikenella sp. NML96-A-049]|uniref:hypothetical protein n=1 Tax=unclassified Eikenella TaxID=2639367 RepID=UPI0007DF0DBD|nr:MULTISPECIES: hypothetical protein [unclassified Eikenella]OAM32477.1 hypothetical protein A7P96_02340 [Eikenella sp. NML03-A-027]OAM35274.1 hypothetical protein A7P97_01095 [Eikenella sp. NML070372]OAM40647.1 hypothetical protein A7Q01_03360 [Eikenella sp. NML96-A-049]VDH01430.1 Uncharacterised protein [Helicobacter pametensis]
MNIRALLLACLAMLTACTAPQPATTAAPSMSGAQPEQQAANRVLIVLYDPAVGSEPLLQTVRRLERVPGVLQVRRDQIMQLQNPAAH